MRIAIMGTGGVGGYYGALLVRNGYDVSFIARNAHLQALRNEGLRVKSLHGDFAVAPIKATEDPAEIGPVDLILFTTKTYHTEEAAKAVKPMVAPNTTILPLQNGVDAAERIGSVCGKEHVVGGVTWISAAIEAPGVIGQYSPFRRILLGELDGRLSSRVETIREVLKNTGPTIEVVPNIVEILWTKFVFISSISALGALTRVTVGEYRSIEETAGVLKDAIGEVVSIACARGVTLAADVIARTLSAIADSPSEMKPSMQRDVENGRRSELESLIGIVVRLGKELNVATPVMDFAYASLKPGEWKALAESAS
jgi:2-dehydropantoate 2-reductase